jgi:hypothetical protein
MTGKPVRVVCAWCWVEKRAGPGPTSFGICARCLRRVLADIVAHPPAPPAPPLRWAA